jgi:acyl-ACP thioesterase
MDHIKTSEHTVSMTQVDANKKMRPTVLMDLLQDIAAEHAARIGIGVDDLAKKGLAWFAAKFHIKIKRLPHWQEQLKIQSWLSGRQKLFALRDIQIIDKDKQAIVLASSGWLVIDVEKKRPQRPDRSLGEVPCYEKRVIETTFDELPEPKIVNVEKEFEPTFNMIDANDHVNSTAYLMWAIEAMPKNVLQVYRLAEIEIAFKNETLYGQKVIAKTQIVDENNSVTAIHAIINEQANQEAARLRTVWKK